MRKFVLLSFAILVSIIMGACKHSENLEFDWLPSVKNSHEILLYNRFEQRFLTYNTETYSIVEENTSPNYYQFEFNNPVANLYTTGHSIENHYKIISKNNNTLTEIVSMGPLEAIFPLALESNKKAFFLKCYYDKEGNELYNQRTICYMNIGENKLEPLKNTKGILTSFGVCYNKDLYFTAYIVDKDSYNLYKIENSNSQNRPKLLKENLETPELYVCNNQLWISNKDTIYCNDKKFTKKSLNYFYLDKLIQMQPNANGDLVLSVKDINDVKNETVFKGVIDFRLEGKKIRVYTYHGIELLDL